MKKAGGLLGLVIALAIGYFIFKTQMTQGPTGGAPPKQVIDVVGVKNDLIAIGEAERMYMASHGTYASVEQIRQEGTLAVSDGSRRGYAYSVEFEDGSHFEITATPTDPAKKGWPTLKMDETMQVQEQ
jgi:hypothetical protein